MSIHAHLLHKANIPLVSTKHMNEYKLPCSFFFFFPEVSGTWQSQGHWMNNRYKDPPKLPSFLILGLENWQKNPNPHSQGPWVWRSSAVSHLRAPPPKPPSP